MFVLILSSHYSEFATLAALFLHYSCLADGTQHDQTGTNGLFLLIYSSLRHHLRYSTQIYFCTTCTSSGVEICKFSRKMHEKSKRLGESIDSHSRLLPKRLQFLSITLPYHYYLFLLLNFSGVLPRELIVVPHGRNDYVLLLGCLWRLTARKFIFRVKYYRYG